MMTVLVLTLAVALVAAVFGFYALRVLLTGAGIGLRGVARCGLCSAPTPPHRLARCPSCNVPTDRAGIITPLDLARRVSWLGSICASAFLVIVASMCPLDMLIAAVTRGSVVFQATALAIPLVVQYILAALTFIACIIVNVRRFQLLHSSTS